jgi:hypothetical protein
MSLVRLGAAEEEATNHRRGIQDVAEMYRSSGLKSKIKIVLLVPFRANIKEDKPMTRKTKKIISTWFWRVLVSLLAYLVAIAVFNSALW